MNNGRSDWLRESEGVCPVQSWSFTADAPLIDVQVAGESGRVFAADNSGMLYHLDRHGILTKSTRVSESISQLATSWTGNHVAVVADGIAVAQFDANWKLQWSQDQPARISTLAMSPYGEHLAVAFVDASNVILTAGGKKHAHFSAIRPLRNLQFLVEYAELIAAAEHGFLGRYDIDGQAVWKQILSSNVGEMTATGDGRQIYCASFNHGIMVFNRHGEPNGTWVIEGTTSHVATTFEKGHLIVATVERHLARLKADGNLRWLAYVNDDILRLAVDPLGKWLICAFHNGRIMRLDERN